MKHILAIADPGLAAQPALARAIALARESGARLLCVAFVYAKGMEALASEIGANQVAKARETLLRERRDLLVQQVAKLGGKEVGARIDVVWEKDIAAWTSDYCAKTPTDLVIKTGQRSERWNYTPTDWLLLRDCSAPVMIVADRAWKKRSGVLAAIDLGTRRKSKQQLNRKVLHSATQLADALNIRLHAIYVIEMPTALVDLDLIDSRKYIADVRRKVAREIEKLAAEFGMAPDQFHVVAGPPDKVIPKAASRLKAEIVVIGTIGRKGVRARLLGNTAEAVLSRLHTDVIAIKPS